MNSVKRAAKRFGTALADAGGKALRIEWRAVFVRSMQQMNRENLRALSGAITATFQEISASRLSVKEQAFFAKRLSFLITAEIPILESLHMLRDQTRSRAYGIVIDTVIDDVSNGQYLSKSLGKFPNMFGQFAINIIKIGETSGILHQNLDYLAEELKKKQMLRRKMIGALVYPALITCATLGITVFLMVYLFPKILPIFASLHMTLPLSTRIVIATSAFLRHWGLLLLLLIVAMCAGFTVALRRSLPFHAIYDAYLLKIPLIGKMVRYYNLANTTRTLGLLLKSGIVLSSALSITAETTKNLVYKKEFHAMAAAANRGERVSLYLDRNRLLFPDVLSQMVAVGERSGNLPDTLVYLSELYEHEVDDFTKDLSSLVEPALMIFMGIFVGFIAISIITPIYGITQNLHP